MLIDSRNTGAAGHPGCRHHHRRYCLKNLKHRREALSSGKIDTTGDPSTVPLVAPEGQVITSYYVKAGSAKQGDGPVYVQLDPSQWTSSITIGHPFGKAISHYSFSLGAPAPTPEPDPEVPGPDPEPRRLLLPQSLHAGACCFLGVV